MEALLVLTIVHYLSTILNLGPAVICPIAELHMEMDLSIFQRMVTQVSFRQLILELLNLLVLIMKKYHLNKLSKGPFHHRLYQLQQSRFHLLFSLLHQVLD